MPEATSFTALGRGNGFPFCVSKVNVSDRFDGQPYDYWTTLSGVNRTNVDTFSVDALEDKKTESLLRACNLWWNLSGFSADTFYSSISASTTYETSVNSASIGVFDEVGSAIEPMSRVCKSSTLFSSQLTASTTDPNGTRIVNSLLKGSITLARMYDGDVGNEENFVGYGAARAIPFFNNTTTPNYLVSSQAGAGRTGSGCYVTLGGYMDEQTVSDFDQQYEYVVVGGSFHFVCAAGASNFYATPTVIPSSLLASVSFVDSGFTVSMQAKITALDFYTY